MTTSGCLQPRHSTTATPFAELDNPNLPDSLRLRLSFDAPVGSADAPRHQILPLTIYRVLRARSACSCTFLQVGRQKHLRSLVAPPLRHQVPSAQ